MVLVGSADLFGYWCDEGVESLGQGALWRTGSRGNVCRDYAFVAIHLRIKKRQGQPDAVKPF